MCYICENINEDKEIYSDGKDRWYMKRLSNGHWYLFHKNVNIIGRIGIEIQNCPMCGRKLEREEHETTVAEDSSLDGYIKAIKNMADSLDTCTTIMTVDVSGNIHGSLPIYPKLHDVLKNHLTESSKGLQLEHEGSSKNGQRDAEIRK